MIITKKEIFLLLLAVFLLVLGTFIAGTILKPYSQELGAAGITLGIITSGLYIVRLFVGTPIGKLADKRGTVAVLRYSLILYPFIAVSYWLAFDILTLIVARLLHGLASAMMLPMAMAYMGEISPEGQEGRYMGIYNTVIFLASGIGPQISTLIAYNYGNRYTFLTLFVLATISLVIVLTLKRSDRYKADNINKSDVIQVNRSYLSMIRCKGLLALSSINISLAAVSSLIGFFFITFPATKGISLVFAGSIIAFFNIACGLIQMPLGRVTDKYNKYMMILITGISTAFILIIFPFTYNLWQMLLLIFLLAISTSISLSALSALSAIMGRKLGMGTTMGFLGTSNSVGMILGCISMSLISNESSNQFIFYLTGGIVLVCTAVFSLLWSERFNNKEIID